MEHPILCAPVCWVLFLGSISTAAANNKAQATGTGTGRPTLLAKPGIPNALSIMISTYVAEDKLIGGFQSQPPFSDIPRFRSNLPSTPIFACLYRLVLCHQYGKR